MYRIFGLHKRLALVITTLLLLSGIIYPLSSILLIVGGDAPFSSNIEASHGPGITTQNNPSLAVDSNGNLYVAWEDYRDGDWDIYIANSTDGGATWSNPDVRINRNTTNDQRLPSLAVDSNGTLYVAWQDARNGTDLDIYLSKSTDGGATWLASDIRVNTDASGMPQTTPSLAVDSNGTIYVVWEDFRFFDFDIYFAMSTDGGVSWSDPNERVNADPTAYQFNPTIAVDSNDTIYVAWEDEININTDIYFARSTDGGANWTDPSKKVNSDATSNHQFAPSIAVNSSGTVYLTWEDYRNGDADIYFALSSDGGATFSSPNVRVSTGVFNKTQGKPSIGVDAENSIYCTWEDYRDNHNDIYFAKSTNQGANWTDPNLRVNDDPGTKDQDKPSLVVAPNSSVYVAWADYRFDNYDIFFSSFVTPPPPPTTDYVQIRTEDAGGGINLCDPANYPIYPKGTIKTFYGAAYNNSVGYIGSVPLSSTWNSTDTNVVDVTSPGASSTITASSVNVGWVWVELDDKNGHINQTNVTVMDFEVDYILIRDAPAGGGNNLCDPVNYPSYPVGHSITLHGAEWNESVGYLRDVPTSSTWDSDDPTIVTVTTPGSNSILTCNNTNWGIVTVTLDDGQGNENTTQVNVLTPTTDYVQIRDAPDGGGNILTNMIYEKGATDDYYGSAYNDTAGYIGPVPSSSTWNSNNTNIVTVTSPGNFTTINCDIINSGWVWITLDDGEGNQNQTRVNVLGWGIDYVLIRDAPGGAGNNLCVPANYPNFPVGHTATFYGAIYNITAGYIGDVSSSSTWESDDTSIIVVTPTGSWASITCDNQNWGTVTITLTDIDNGASNTTQVTVLEPTVDYIQIRDSPSGGGIVLSDPANYPVYSQAYETTFYGAEYNDTAGYIGSVPVTSTWDSNDTSIVAVSSPTNETTVTCSNINIGLVWITLDDGDGHENHTLVTVIKAGLDYIQIRDAPNGEGTDLCDPDNYPVFGVGHTTKFYAAGYNLTEGYISDISVTWSVTDDSIVNVTTSGIYTDITCSDTKDGTVTITADYSPGNINTTQVTVLPPTIDYIQIRDAPLGGGNVVTTGTYVTFEQDSFYAAAYNDTAGYLEDPEVSWSSDNTAVGQVSSPGIWTNFTAQKVAINSTCKVTATYSPGITDATDILTVLAPEIDEIMIRDGANEDGNIVIIRTYSALDTDTFYAAGYNDTAGYVKDVEVIWVSDDNSVGQVTSPGFSTIFTAQNVAINSTCMVTARYTPNISNSTGLITVEPIVDPTVDVIPPSPPSQPTLDLIGKNKIEITWDPNTESDLDGYIIQRSTSSDGPWINVTVLNKETTSYNDTDLELDTTYYYQIIAVDEAGNPSDPSPLASETTGLPEDGAFPWVLVALIIIIIIIAVFVLLFFIRKKSE